MERISQNRLPPLGVEPARPTPAWHPQPLLLVHSARWPKVLPSQPPCCHWEDAKRRPGENDGWPPHSHPEGCPPIFPVYKQRCPKSDDGLLAHIANHPVEHCPVVGLDQPLAHQPQPGEAAVHWQFGWDSNPWTAPGDSLQHIAKQWSDEEVFHSSAQDAGKTQAWLRGQWQKHRLGKVLTNFVTFF